VITETTKRAVYYGPWKVTDDGYTFIESRTTGVRNAPGGSGYHIEAGRVPNGHAAAHWLAHVGGKMWVSDEDWGLLAEAFSDTVPSSSWVFWLPRFTYKDLSEIQKGR